MLNKLEKPEDTYSVFDYVCLKNKTTTENKENRQKHNIAKQEGAWQVQHSSDFTKTENNIISIGSFESLAVAIHTQIHLFSVCTLPLRKVEKNTTCMAGSTSRTASS